MDIVSKEDIKRIVAIVGREGAIAALSNSKRISSDCLVELASSLRLKVTSRDPKGKIAAQIVRHVDKRITKPLDELKAMSGEEIVNYFEQTECDQDEIVELLGSIDLRSRAKSRRAMLEFAAIQISSLGIFERLSDRHS